MLSSLRISVKPWSTPGLGAVLFPNVDGKVRGEGTCSAFLSKPVMELKLASGSLLNRLLFDPQICFLHSACA